jgi:uncharacterized protein
MATKAAKPARRARVAKGAALPEAMTEGESLDEILELTEAMPGDALDTSLELEDALPESDNMGFDEVDDLIAEISAPAVTVAAAQPRPASAGASSPSIVSQESEAAARASLATLSSLIVKPSAPQAADNTLEGLVREMLRPMLKDWLDTNLPTLVEGMVAKEIARITGRSL